MNSWSRSREVEKPKRKRTPTIESNSTLPQTAREEMLYRQGWKDGHGEGERSMQRSIADGMIDLLGLRERFLERKED